MTNKTLKPLLLGALMTLPLIAPASADRFQDKRREAIEELRENRQQLRDAENRGDWNRVQQERQEVRASEIKLQRYGGYRGNYGNGYNGNNNYGPPLNNGYYNNNAPYNYNNAPYNNGYNGPYQNNNNGYYDRNGNWQPNNNNGIDAGQILNQIFNR